MAGFKKKAAEKSIAIKLPKSVLTVHGDPDQLVELFVTILENAVKYSPSSTEITVSIRTEGGMVVVSVTDQGVGIAKHERERIFDRFYRADQSRNKIKADGYGLGLSLAQAIAHTHGGKITVDSKKNSGSTFNVCLPV